MSSGYKKILIFLDEIQDEVWDNGDCDLNDLCLEFQEDYEYYGWKIETNILQINFPGSSDWFYFISIPDKEMKIYKKNLDEYPIYFVDLEEGILEKKSKNFKGFMKIWFDNDERLERFSSKYYERELPHIIKLDID